MRYESEVHFGRIGPPPAPPGSLAAELRGRRLRRLDPFYWMRDLARPEVRRYLADERSYAARLEKELEPAISSLVAEFHRRVPQPSESYPLRRGAFEYFTRTLPEQQYPVHLRRRHATGEEDVVLDENALAAGAEFFSLGGLVIADDDTTLAWSTDLVGDERFTLSLGRVGSRGPEVEERLAPTSYGLVFTNDSRGILYTQPDATGRPYRVLLHWRGTDASRDALLFEEEDPRFFVDLGRTHDRTFLVITSSSARTSECWLADPLDPTSLECFAPRTPGREYVLEHALGRFYLMVADGEDAEYTLMESEGRGRPWTPLAVLEPNERLEGFVASPSGLVLETRLEDLTQVSLLSLPDRRRHLLSEPDPALTCSVISGLDPDDPSILIEETSLTRPTELVRIDPPDLSRTVVWRQPVGAEVDLDSYVTFRAYAPAADGAMIPITIAHRRDLSLPAPALVYAYGAYGEPVDPSFSILRLSLLDRGFVYAIAHVRGGGELGRAWHVAGRLSRKPTTFTDLGSALDWLVSSGLGDPSRLTARGASAGGLTIGAALNLAPSRLRAAVLEVPFLDCLTTISDPELPLTATEWEEWGDPITSDEDEERMARWSPYDNICPERYPDLLVTTHLSDNRVSWWEPTKYVAKLRRESPETNVALFAFDVAGHQGATAREDRYRDEARVLAFLLAATRPIEMTS